MIVDWLAQLGVVGLLLAMAAEGSSLPFPGFIVVVTYGFLLYPSLAELVGYALAMSIVYCAASYVPYFVGYRLETAVPKRFRSKLHAAKNVFHRYGLWSIALTRPFGIGNYISYVAGMCRVRAIPYALYTLIGVFPWAFTMLLLGRTFQGNVQAVGQFFNDYQGYLFAALAVAICLYVLYVVCRRGKIKVTDRE
ncbi:DedA family protein [Numidum massiliense]|uniref:DedA family protein n=1 Tax=Numidum massiliense TaxID=1522315 RepID=UPI00093A18FB|nr:VTT domain-containing protein [Numidum massiliense]